MDYGGGDHLTADQSCTPTLSVTQQRRCSCSCRLWRYLNVMMP